jgi:hypothetical protein
MAAAEIRRLDPGEALPQGYVATNSIKFDIDGPVPEALLVDITKELGEGFEVSAMRYPDGIVVDINPRFGDAGPEAPQNSAINRATKMLESRYNAGNIRAFDSAYRSEFGKNYVEDPGTGAEYNRIIKETLKGWNDEAIKRITDLAGKGVKRSDISKFLAGKLDTLSVGKDQGGRTASVQSIRGRAETIRKQLRQRISDHNAAVKSFSEIGKSVDSAMTKALPKWEKRAEAQRKKITPEQKSMTKSAIKLPKNLDEILEEFGETVANVNERDRLWSQGLEMFVFHEMDERPSRITSFEMLQKAMPEAVIAVQPDLLK